MNRSILLAAALVVFGAGDLQAQHHDLGVASSANGSGDLQVDYPFDSNPVIGVFDSGFDGLFSIDEPGFIPLLPDEPSFFELDLGTSVSIEITDIDPNVSLQVGATTLDAVGDIAELGTHDQHDSEASSLHNHPAFQLGILADANTFGEGTFSFRLKDTSGAPIYGASPVYKLRVSNGYLPHLEALEDPMASEDEKSAALKCQKAAGGAARQYMTKTYQLLEKCFDQLMASAASGSEKAALKACALDGSDGSLTGKLAELEIKSFSKVSKACGGLSPSSVPFTASTVHAHLGMAACRAQELAGATYNNAAHHLGELLSAQVPSAGDETTVTTAFPCLKGSQAE